MPVELLQKDEKEYFLQLYRNFGITSLEVDETGCSFKEEELTNFLNPSESPEVGLEKALALNKITKKILMRMNFNYHLKISESDITLEFVE